MKTMTLVAMLFCALLLTACSLTGGKATAPTPDVAATVRAAVAATDAARPPAIPVQVTVEVPVTVISPVTVIVTNTPEPPTEVAPPTATATPQTGATAVPTVNAGPGPDPLANTGSVLFEEDFIQPNFWGVGEDAVSKFAIKDGKLIATLKERARIAWALNGISGSNFYVQATVTSGACKGGDYYGLIFRAVDESNLYFFGVSCDGKFKVLKDTAGELTTLVDFTANNAIRQLAAANLIGVRADGNQLSFYANNTFLGTVTDDAFTEGDFGVGLRSFQSDTLTVSFDDFTAWVIQH